MAHPGRVVGALAAVLGLSALASPGGALSRSAMPREVGSANPTIGAEVLPLPRPQQADVLPVPGVTADRKRISHVPGAVDDREEVTIRLDGTGAPSAVEVVQRLRITGVGDYGIYERGPARRAQALDDTSPPVAKLGTVVWQGFSPGRRELAAKLTLDPGIESLRLPLGVSLDFVSSDGHPGAVGPGGALPGAGTLTITLADQTAQAGVPVSAGAADPRALAATADTLLAAAAKPGREPPVAGHGLPTGIAAEDIAQRQISVSAALSISGRIDVRGTSSTASGAGLIPTATGGRVRGVLNGGAVSFKVLVDGAGTLDVDLTVVPTVDRRSLPVPQGLESWSAWADSHPSLAQRRAATDTVVAAAAAAVRAADFYPYLQADLPGRAAGSFRYQLDKPSAAARARVGLDPRSGPIALSVLASVLILGNAAALRRLS